MKLTDMFRVSHCWVVPKLGKIGAKILQSEHRIQWPCVTLQVKNWVFILSLGGAVYVINVFNMALTDVFKTKSHWSLPKITQICSYILKIWAVKHSGLVFGPPCTCRLDDYLLFLRQNVRKLCLEPLKSVTYGYAMTDLTVYLPSCGASPPIDQYHIIPFCDRSPCLTTPNPLCLLW